MNVKMVAYVLIALAQIPSVTAAPQRFPELLAELSDSGMSKAEKLTVHRCKAQAEAVYNVSVATYPPGDFTPDMVATRRLIECMKAGG